MTNTVAFHGSAREKRKYIERVRQHRLADELIRGVTYEEHNGKIRGCGIGCTLHCYDHAKYPAVLGVPVQIAYLEDWLFENLPTNHLVWPEHFLAAIRPGADLSGVYPAWVCRLLTRRLESLGNGQEDWRQQCREALGRVRNLYQFEMPASARSAWSASESAWSASESASAESAARSAARSARSAARSAAESAESAAQSAAESAQSAAQSAAESAQSAAQSAAESAQSAAQSAAESAQSARSAEIQRQADDLLELLAAV